MGTILPSIIYFVLPYYRCTFATITKDIDLKTFEELGVSEAIRRAVEELGYEQPMPVQDEVIPYLLG